MTESPTCSRWPPKPPKVTSINLVDRLRLREVGNRRQGSHHLIGARDLYWSLYPRVTVVNVDKPPCFLRKFTPDGRYLIAFSSAQTSILVYEYRGVTAAGQLMSGSDVMLWQDDEEFGSIEARQNLFDTLFCLKHSITVLEPNAEALGPIGQLNRECSLFTADSRHLIVASSCLCSQTGDRFPGLLDFYQTNESLSPSVNLPVEDIRIFSVDIVNGRVCDEQRFKCDKIVLSHNQGLYLCERFLSVLSIQHQTIHIFQVEPELGRLIPLQQIGRFLFDDDEMLLRPYLVPASEPSPDTAHRFAPMVESVMTGLKHRVMSWLFRKARDTGIQSRFFQNFDHFRHLRLWKMQMVDSDIFLFRLASEDLITMKVDPNTQPTWYVMYNWKTTEVLGVYDCYSRELLDLYEKCTDQFRHPDGKVTFPCSTSSCHEAKSAHQRFKRTLDNAKGGCESETVRRVLSQLPLASQTFATTPYLDVSMFSYDDKLISQLERPKVAGDSYVRFFSRRTNRLAFQLQCGLGARGGTHSGARNLVAFIFHPTDPFAISVQRSSHRGEYTANFHLPANVPPST
uniref:DET1 homolog n=1 Tax=Plectus sambesii TaxID=2011161 RepID=A0A914WV84_9BILA